MKIYVDLVFLLNIFFDFLLLLSVSLILRRNVSIKRIILGGITGGSSIFLLFLNITKFELFLIKIVIAFLMVIVTFKYRNLKYTLKNFVYLYIVSIVLGGFLYLINTEFSYDRSGIIFINNGLSINIVLLIIASPLLLYLYIREMKSIKKNYTYYYKVCVYFNSGKHIILNGYLDSGNNLIDPYKFRPIVLISYDRIKEYIKNEKELIVPYKVLNNSDILRCIKIEKIVVNNKVYRDVLVGISFNKIYIDGIDCILNNKMEGLWKSLLD